MPDIRYWGCFYEKISVPNTASKKNVQKRQQV